VCIWKLHKVRTEFKTRSRHLGPSFKLSLSFLLLHSTSITFLLHLSSANHFLKIIIVTVARASNWKFIFRQIQNRSVFTTLVSSTLYIFFLFGLLIFPVKLKYTNNRIYCSYCRDKNIADQCVSRSEFWYSCRLRIFCRRDNQSSWLEEADSCWFEVIP
jgi:hypothetical protein